MSTTITRLAYIDTAGSGTTTSGAVGSAVPAGTYMVAVVVSSGGGSTIGFSDSKGNTWHKRQDASNGSSPSAVCDIFTTDDAGLTTALTATDTVTGTSTAGSGCGDIMLLKLIPDTGTLTYNNGSTGTGSSTTPGVTAFTPGTGNLILSFLCASSASLNSQTTPGAGFTKIAGIDAHSRSRSVVGQYGTAGAGTTTAAFGLSPAQQYAVAAISITQAPPPTPTEFVGECVNYTYSGTSTKTVTVPVTHAVAAGQTVVLAVNCPSGSPNSGATVTDTAGGNTWTFLQGAAQNGIGSNGQPQLVACTLVNALTTSDHLTITVTGNEIQTVTEGGSGLTSFTLTYSGQTTGSIAAAASAATVQTALEALSNIGVGDVAVTGSSGGPYTVTFQGALANTNVSQMTATPTGGTGTVTVATQLGGGGVGTTIWGVYGMAFTGITGYDKGAANNGASSSTLTSGTTGAAAQNRQLVVAAFGYGGTGVTLITLPTDFTAQPVVATTGTVRNLCVVWGLVNASGTRSVTAHMSDAASHAWAGVVAAFNSNAPVPDTTTWFLPDGSGGWDKAEALVA